MRGMRKRLTGVLILLITSGVSFRSAYASSAQHDAEWAARVKLQIDGLAPGTSVKVRLKNHRKIEGKLGAHAEESFQVNTPQPTEISYTAVKIVIEAPGDQATPGNNQSPPRHHSHLLRNGLIVFGACFAFALVVAVASK